MSRMIVGIGAVSAALGVAAGAFGAHALRSAIDPSLLAAFETGARYQMYHAFALLVVGVSPGVWSRRVAVMAGWLLGVGTVLFSGSLYAMALTGHRWLGAVTPIGGLCFLAAWLALALGVRRGPAPSA